MNGELRTFLDLLTSGEPQDGSWLEVRSKLPSGGMRQEFVPSRAHRAASALIDTRGSKLPTFVSVGPRSRPEGTRDAVERLHAVWVDADTPEAVQAVDDFEPKPSAVSASGNGRHGYWSLVAPVAPDEAECANRRLAHALGADMASTDAARVMRAPGTFNWKSGKPVPVTVERVDPDAVYALEQVVGHLPDPPAEERRARAAQTVELDPGDPLLALPPEVYVEALTGQGVGRDSKVACPFHDDRTPSLHVYATAEDGWHCFGCGRGGTVIDFGAALYDLEPRGRGYVEIRRRLVADLGSEVAA